MPASTILLLTSDPASGEAISGSLTGVGYTVTTVSQPEEALRAAADNQLLILDVIAGPRTAADVCGQIRQTPELAAVPVLCIAQSDEVEERIRFLEAGADDVMARPFDDRELQARVEALLLRFQRSRDLTPIVAGDGLVVAPPKRQVVSVFSPKGGVGTTTIATNVAMVQARTKPESVILIDLDLQFGQAATHLNVVASQSIAELVSDPAALREPELLRSYAVRHESGLHILPAPSSPEQAELVEPKHLGQLIDTATQAYDSVVIDAGSILDERSMTVFERSDAVVLPIYPEIAALKALRSLLDYLVEAGSLAGKTTYVLNNMFAREILRRRDVESALGAKIEVELPYDPFLYLKAVNEGVPVVLGAPRSTGAERLTRLAESIFGGAEPIAAPARARRDKPEKRARLGILRRS